MGCWLLINLLLFLRIGGNNPPVLQNAQKIDFVELCPDQKWRFSPGGEKSVMITFTIRDGYHIQANKPLDVNLIPTELTIIPSGEFMIYEPKFPAPVPFQLKNDPEAMMVFDGKLEILLPIVVRENTKNGSYQIKGNLKYQACDSVKCYFPRNVLFEVPVQVR